jgi:hypothetical protein
MNALQMKARTREISGATLDYGLFFIQIISGSINNAKIINIPGAEK